MRNKAKCKLCGSVIESYHSMDYVACTCGEISLDGGDAMRCYAVNDLANIIRIDDDGNEIVPKIVHKETIEQPAEVDSKPTRADMLTMLDDMINSYEALPKQGLQSYCTNADLCSALMLIRSIVKCES